MGERLFALEDLERLREWDTPSICNGLELLFPERRGLGFTTQTMVVADRSLPPMVGVARVGMIRAREHPRGQAVDRLDWYDYVADAELPTIVVIQDLDDRPGFGAFWGEVHTAVHQALGARGCVTNGSFRDINLLAPGFQILGGRVGPSHGFVHVVDYGRPVSIFGMQTCHDDIVHADLHGAVIVPAEAVRRLPEAIAAVEARERVILAACRDPLFDVAKLREAVKRSSEIH